MNERHRRRIAGPLAAAAAAFSLIEILIAVLILALGLLGIGAIFPVVVREQKLGNDIIVGTIAANSARTQLQGMDLAAASGDPLFWQNTRARLTPDTDYEEGQWAPSFMDEPHVGAIFFGSVSDPDIGVEIPVAARLYPMDAPASGPQYVWDAAIQRVPDGDGDLNNDDLRVAIFVRRVDPRIRYAAREPLAWVLTQRSGNPAQWRVPVAEDADGVPTYDGHGGAARPEYSQIRTLGVRFDYAVSGAPDKRRRDRLFAENATAENSVEWRLAKQPNQKLIDNFGNVYTVMESGESGGDEFIRVSPDIPAYITQNDQIIQVAFTPQVAAAIVTWRVTP